ncbi:DUF4434 domain-containing protein [Streptomyces melanogenes]|uniref:DUF4434 domain-containing protein n=1 Tax=Streptomyces melanogenes TaxID=67326 RepID=UPI001E646BCE|nr:DUF4434 domain-containing protein [Streptomyces melanogenes]
MHTLTDDCSGITAGKWVSFGNVGSADGRFHVTSHLEASYPSISSDAAYSLAGSCLLMEVTDAGNQCLPSWEVFPCKVKLDSGNWMSFRIDNGSIRARRVADGTTTDSGSTAYSATNHRWLRIRESGGMTYWETSADGVVWNSFHRITNPFPVVALRVEIAAGNWAAEPSASTARFDNINLPPSGVDATGPAGAAGTVKELQNHRHVPPAMRATFIQPMAVSGYPNFPTVDWTQAQYERNFALMTSVGIDTVCVQFTVDRDAGEAYYPSAMWPQRSNMVELILNAAEKTGVKVWVGLANTWWWEENGQPGDYAWLTCQLADDKACAEDLDALYGDCIHGWYIPNEVGDQQLANAAYIDPMKWFYGEITAYLHGNFGRKPVMSSPSYFNLTLDGPTYAAKLREVMPDVDVVAVQDGGGYDYISASDIHYWFTHLRNEFRGTSTALWHNADMFSASANTPMPPGRLQDNLQATCGLVAGYTGFSFISQMGPDTVGTDAYWAAYGQYAATYVSHLA